MAGIWKPMYWLWTLQFCLSHVYLFYYAGYFYKDNPKAGERRRVWASCQVDGYSDIAGGHSFRQSQGERMRFKVLHKISDHKKRFGYHMCVGCGRCENVCPEYISYIECLQKLKEKEGK